MTDVSDQDTPDFATVAALPAAGIDTHKAGEGCLTAPAAAVFECNLETVDTLLAVGANPHDRRPFAGATAEFFGFGEMSELLRGK